MKQWKKVPINEFSFYEISNFGDIRNGDKILKPSIHKGYQVVVLCNKGFRRTINVHRLVALAFIDNPNNLPCVNHKDGNKQNNCVFNLEWCTHGQNEKHAWKLGLITFTDNMRKAVTKTVLKEVEKQKKPVKCFQNGKLIKVYESASEAARSIHGDQAHISECCNGRRLTHKGFSWAWT